MTKILKNEKYAVISTGESKFGGDKLAESFRLAAVRKGICVSSLSMYADAAIIYAGENVPFSTMQQMMDDIARVTQRTVILSPEKDLLGKSVMSCTPDKLAENIRREALLISPYKP